MPSSFRPGRFTVLVGLAGTLLQASACREEDPLHMEPPGECDVSSQKDWVYETMTSKYLWSADIPDVDVADFETPEDLLPALRKPEIDRWSRIADKTTSDAFFQEGKFLGLGYDVLRDANDDIRITFVHPGSPAAAAGFQRGDTLVAIGEYTIEQIDADGLWGTVYGENAPDVQVTITVRNLAGEERTETLAKSWIDIVTVPVHSVLDVGGRRVGYLMFETFVKTAEQELNTAFDEFIAAGVDTVVMDMRYNGGGLISIATHIADLFVGATHEGDVSYRATHNESLAEENRESRLAKQASSLPAVSQIVFITTRRTLSASELVINMLRPYTDVRIVGTATGGKPVGSYSYEFCEKLLFPITFRLVNADGESDYFDGLAPDCSVSDDLTRQFGDPEEASLKEALALVGNGACSADAPAALPRAADPPAPNFVAEFVGM